MYVKIYALSFLDTLLLMGCAAGLWYGGKAYVSGKATGGHWKWICAIGMACWILSVLWVTVLFREAKALPPIWMPFQQIYDLTHGGNPEILRSIWMNILLFIPGGVILPELFPAKWRNRSKVILTVILAMLLSLGIELAQWHWQLGQAETDDVIANTLGAFLGCGIFILGNRIISRKRGS